MFLNKKQITKMRYDIHAFLITAEKVEIELRPYIQDIANYTTSSEEYGRIVALSTSMQTNLGMGIELTLKRIGYITGYPSKIKDHKLTKIYNNRLTLNIRNQLDQFFSDWVEEAPQICVVISNSPDTQPIPDIRNFRQLLEFLDQHDLYGQRYSFENFTIEKPQIIIIPTSIAPIINKMNEHWV